MSNDSDNQKLLYTTAHVLAYAIKSLYRGVKMGECGLTEKGFYYDFEFTESFSSDELPVVEEKMREIINENMPVLVSYKTKEDLEKTFTARKSPYKAEILAENNRKRVDTITIGDKYEDLFSGVTLKSTSEVKVFTLENVSGAYWKGNEENKMLTRIYGVSFYSEDEMNAYLERESELLRRDHRVLGKKLKYFSFDPSLGQGVVVWNTRGMYLRSMLERLVMKAYKRSFVSFVETPILTNRILSIPEIQPESELVVAKHVDGTEEEQLRVRQQMLDGHINIFTSMERSYRDLPWRVGEIGKVMRYERSGTLEGLTRLREMTQDNMTIICAREQVEKEVDNILVNVITLFREIGLDNFSISLHLPTPDRKSQKQENLLVTGAVQGAAKRINFAYQTETTSDDLPDPELRISIKDSLDQVWAMSKIQIMSSVPIARGVTYMGKDGQGHIPYIIRATISGSIERLIALLLEHYAGVLPLWLTYEQVRVLSVTSNQEVYAEKVAKTLSEAGIRSRVDLTSDTLEAKIKQAEEDKVPYMLIVGEKEANTAGVSVRIQKKGDIGLLDLESFVKTIQQELSSKSIKSLL